MRYACHFKIIRNNFKKEVKRNLYIVRNSVGYLMFRMITNVSFLWILRKPVIDQKSSFV